jgi:transketolase
MNYDLRAAKLRLLRMHYEANVGHIGGNLSCLDMLLWLGHEVINGEHDKFWLSKGHAAGAFYIMEWTLGVLCEECLKSFHKDHTLLGGHLYNTGSLGHGLGIATGIALHKKVRNEPGMVYVMTSDGEWDEGSNWEALKFIVDQNLSNIKIIVDCNGLQGFKWAEASPILATRFKSFVQTESINGHDRLEFVNACKSASTVIMASTIKGKGVSFLENKLASHYDPLTEEQYKLAIREVLNAESTN